MTTDRWPGVKIGIVAGNFDVIHPGYVKMFQDAKENACNVLIVALQGDPTIERPYKCKPVQTVEERQYILSSIKYVDEVVHYNTEAELLKLLETIDWDVRIVGTDYKNIDYTGKYLEKKLKRSVYFHKRDHEYSLTDLKKKIMEQMLAQNKR
jgi:glycerol-3-phosphate cytidylyltransferase